MANTYTSNVKLAKPDPSGQGDAGWGATTNTNWDMVASFAAVRDLAVKETEVPSTTLNVRVAAGKFRAADGTIVTYAGTASQATTLSTTNYIYLTNSGTLTVNTTGYPAATDIVRLATVVAGVAEITDITDDRAVLQSFGATVSSGGAPTTAKYIVQVADAGLSAEQALGALATGILKNTTTTGVLSIAAAGTDYLAPSGSGAALTALNATQLTTGTVATARMGTGTADSTTYLRGDGTWVAPSGSGDVVGPAASVDSEVVLFNSTTGKLIKRATTTGLAKLTSGVLSAAAAGTDYLSPSGSGASLTALNGTQITTGTVPTARLGSGTASSTTYLRGDQTWQTISGTGDASTNTATSVDSEVVLFSSTTGKLLKRATTTGLAKLTSGVLSAATAGTDYVAPGGAFSGTTVTASGDVSLTGSADLVLSAGSHVIIATTGAGTMIGNTTSALLSFWAATPVTRPASGNQAALTDSSGGTASTTIGAISDAATKDAVASLARLLNQLRSDLVTIGIIKGSA